MFSLPLTIKGDYYDMGGKLLVAAIDIGTSYSGWAYAYKGSYKKDQTDITVRRWLVPYLILLFSTIITETSPYLLGNLRKRLLY